MGTLKTINLSDEALDSLTKKKKKNPSFNLSGWISAKLIAENEDLESDVDVLDMNLKNKSLQIEQIENEKELLRQKIAENKVKKQEAVDEVKTIEAKKEADKNFRLDSFTDSLLEAYSDISLAGARALAEKYEENREGMSIYEYAKSRGFKEKKE